MKRGQERNIHGGSLWVFSNQIDDSLKNFLPGEMVQLVARNGRHLGIGYVNPHSLIAFRLLSLDNIEINTDFLVSRLKVAQQLRNKILPGEDAVREVFSESDQIPGLVVDRYGEVLVLQIATAGMAALKTEIVAALQEVYHPIGIFERSDISIRKLEGLEEQSGLLSGKVSPKPIWLQFAGINLPVDLRHGQKTGLFLDQRNNIQLLEPLASGCRVLDTFCYVGTWGLKAAKAGAVDVTFMDSSAGALTLAASAARRNKLADRCQFLKMDAFDGLKNLAGDQRQFDLVILDPPSFIRSRAHFKEGYKGYFDLNHRALSVLRPGGVLMTCCCSHHMDEATFRQLIHTVLRRNNRGGRIVYRGQQGPDHPVLMTMPETEYLHCLVVNVD